MAKAGLKETSSTVLQLEAVQRHYGNSDGKVQVLSDVNLSLQAGERVAVVGQSGSGKSTLLHVAGLLDTPDSGQVILAGQNVKGMRDAARAHLRNQHLGFVYQFHHLMGEFTARENVLMPARIKGVAAKEAEERADMLLESVGLAARAAHLPSQMSGGEQQRVAIARALMNRPKLLLADEPTGNLDPQTGEQVFKMFHRMVKEEGMALLMVTHNPLLAQACDRRFELVKGVLKAVK